MRINVDLPSDLLRTALEVSPGRTRREVLIAALEEYVKGPLPQEWLERLGSGFLHLSPQDLEQMRSEDQESRPRQRLVRGGGMTNSEVAPTMVRKLAPVHPGEVLLEEFLIPLGLSQYRLAKDTGMPPRRVNEIVHGKRAVTADTALRLARFLGTTEQFWLNLQTQYDLQIARERLGGRLEKEVVPLTPA